MSPFDNNGEELSIRALRARMERHALATDALARYCRSHPHATSAWMVLGDRLAGAGERRGAQAAFGHAAKSDPNRREISRAAKALAANRRTDAERLFRGVLERDPDHVHALLGLATLATDAQAHDEAQALLNRALALCPNLDALWRARARLESQRDRHAEAEHAARRALSIAPDSFQCWTTLANAQAAGPEPRAALSAFKRSLSIKAEQPRTELALAQLFKILGEREASVAAYQRAVALDTTLGEAFWGLADLKSYRFTEAEITRMQDALAARSQPPESRAAFHFALGKALEDKGRFAEAMHHYHEGNHIRKASVDFDIEKTLTTLRRTTASATRSLFATRRPPDTAAPTPVFVVGMPRSGSTLIEQILASHSRVQGTMELPFIPNYVHALGGNYPEMLGTLSDAALDELGARYLDDTRSYRGDYPYFIDKMPTNFQHLGLIRMMLPQAIVIDARRHPLDCCLSIYKQNFAKAPFSFDLTTIGGYYQVYLAYMAHWHTVMPGGILRVMYEDVVAAPEGQIRRLLDYCGLPFESACLKFHESPRPVRTPSAEQVRQPIYTHSVGHWHHYEAELAPLRNALGDALESYQTF